MAQATAPAVSSASSSTAASSTGLVLSLLFFANFLNFFDRTLPAVYTEAFKHEWKLTDTELGLGATAFTLVYAIVGIPLGRLSDGFARRKVLAACLTVWSVFTGATALAWSFWSLFWIRLGVGVGEAGCAPASSSLIGDLIPSERRSRAMGLFMLGLPLGIAASFFGGGRLYRAFGGWRQAFYVAAVPGLLLALAVLFIREPARGQADGVKLESRVENPIRKILSIPTVWWIILSGVTVNFAVYAGNGFLISVLIRYFHLPILEAADTGGFIAGVTGLVGLTFGGYVADWFHKKNPTARLLYGAGSLLIAAPATALALMQPATSVWAFAVLFGLGWLLYYAYYNTTYPALQDVVEPRLRATAIALYFACMYILGGATGSTVVGKLSDHLRQRAMDAAGATQPTPAFAAIGLHDAFYLIPIMFLITGIAMLLAARSFKKDAEKMQQELAQAAR